MTPLGLGSVLDALAFEVRDSLLRQELQPGNPHHGAFIIRQTGVDEPGHGGTSRFITTCGLLAFARLVHPEVAPASPPTETLLERMEFAAGYLLRVQRGSGLIDLRNVNYDAAPDTGFAVQLLCALCDVTAGDDRFEPVRAKLETFIRRAAPGMMAGGFHTPNHRWVAVGALAQTMALFNDIDVREQGRPMPPWLIPESEVLA